MEGHRRGMPTGRPVLAASLDEETATAFRDFCRRSGVSASAMVEALARAVTTEPEWFDTTVAVARRVDTERRARS